MQFISNLAISRLIPKGRLANVLIKFFVFSFLLIYIGRVILQKNLFLNDFWSMLSEVSGYAIPVLVAVVLLIPVNWGLEALKWQFLVRKIEKISFLKAYRGILTGVSFGLATPHGIGDYAGRILQLSSQDRVKMVGAVFLTRIAQFFVTYFFGTLALLYFISYVYVTDAFLIRTLAYVLALSNTFLIVLFFFHKNILFLLKEVKLLRPVYKYFEILNQYSGNDILCVIGLSFLRYMVFSCQFFALLYLFNVSTNVVILLTGVSFIFLVKSIVPTFFDLGVRESSALYFFGFFNTSEESILFASLLLWVINILFPAFIGLFMIFKIKFFNKW
ncbi:MAG: lysylphosphatidylglycerol synthase domain-containing protein [Cytophagaceae bacterium]